MRVRRLVSNARPALAFYELFIVLGILGLSAGLFLAALPSLRQTADKANTANNLRRIGQAFQAYYDRYHHFPAAAICAKDGKPLLSWRVAILPFLNEEAWFQKFRLDEPWDSAHNKPLQEAMPSIYASPGMPGHSSDGTFFQGLVGPGAMFDGQQSLRMQDLSRGASHTLMIVEAAGAVPWTKPADLPYGENQPLPPLGRYSPGGFHALFADGSVRFFHQSIEPRVLKILISRYEETDLRSALRQRRKNGTTEAAVTRRKNPRALAASVVW